MGCLMLIPPVRHLNAVTVQPGICPVDLPPCIPPNADAVYARLWGKASDGQAGRAATLQGTSGTEYNIGIMTQGPAYISEPGIVAIDHSNGSRVYIRNAAPIAMIVGLDLLGYTI